MGKRLHLIQPTLNLYLVSSPPKALYDETFSRVVPDMDDRCWRMARVDTMTSVWMNKAASHPPTRDSQVGHTVLPSARPQSDVPAFSR